MCDRQKDIIKYKLSNPFKNCIHDECDWMLNRATLVNRAYLSIMNVPMFWSMKLHVKVPNCSHLTLSGNVFDDHFSLVSFEFCHG